MLATSSSVPASRIISALRSAVRSYTYPISTPSSSAALTCTSDQPGREGHFFGDFFRRHLRSTFVADGWRIDGRDGGGSVACPAGMG